jgi:ABC-type molybdate transport system permease subunit
VLSFTFTGLLIGSVVYSLPFAVQPMQHAFAAMGRRPMEVVATLGASLLDAFFTIALPQARAGILTAGILSFAHTVGEFGMVLMIGGNIPGRTRVVSTQKPCRYGASLYMCNSSRINRPARLLCLVQAMQGDLAHFQLALLYVRAQQGRRCGMVAP